MISRVSTILLSASLALALTIAVVYRLQPDALAFATVFPAWCWWLPGVACGLVGWRRASRRGRLIWVAAWLAAMWFSADAPLAVVRGWLPAPAQPRADRSLRVVSFNTGGQTAATWDELVRLHPDVVLLQESYGEDVTAQLAHALFGEDACYEWGHDTSILARGTITPLSGVDRENQRCAIAEVRIGGCPSLVVVSLRLEPQVLRFDLWSPEGWRQYAQLRRIHRDQLGDIVKRCDAFPESHGIVIGGDFNAPARDGVFQLMRLRFTDAFKAAGRGWGCTLLNELPLIRIDQVWVNSTLKPVAAWSARSETSDHRIVVADFIVRAAPGSPDQ